MERRRFAHAVEECLVNGENKEDVQRSPGGKVFGRWKPKVTKKKKYRVKLRERRKKEREELPSGSSRNKKKNLTERSHARLRSFALLTIAFVTVHTATVWLRG